VNPSTCRADAFQRFVRPTPTHSTFQQIHHPSELMLSCFQYFGTSPESFSEEQYHLSCFARFLRIKFFVNYESKKKTMFQFLSVVSRWVRAWCQPLAAQCKIELWFINIMDNMVRRLWLHRDRDLNFSSIFYLSA
jgi:hypothetical protein